MEAQQCYRSLKSLLYASDPAVIVDFVEMAIRLTDRLERLEDGFRGD